MAASTDIQNLRSAWRALSGKQPGEGWRTISVTTSALCEILAGRRHPGGEEAILVGFKHVVGPPVSQLPQGHGFEISKLSSDPTGQKLTWLALARREAGSLELFENMAEDILRLLEASSDETEDRTLSRFLIRIRAWQDFMDRHREGMLSPENELGLFGELALVRDMVAAGIVPMAALSAWQGPVDGLHDFTVGDGAIEVKTTLSVGSFNVTISSLDQLDTRLRQPLYIAAVRLSLAEKGDTLPDMASLVKETFDHDSAALGLYETRLIQAGLLSTTLERYSRRFLVASISLLPVSTGFPRLTRADVHPAIHEACYELNLEQSDVPCVGLGDALSVLRAI
jgi:hypothetical protein